MPSGTPSTRGSRPMDRRNSSTGRVPVASPLPTRQTPEQVLASGIDDVDPAVRVVDPVDGHLVDAQAGSFGEHEQFGVEEPFAVLHQRQQLAPDVGAHAFESALRVGEPGLQRGAQDQLVTARDELAFGAAHHARRLPIGSRSPDPNAPTPKGATSDSSPLTSVDSRRPRRRPPGRRGPPTPRAGRGRGPCAPCATCTPSSSAARKRATPSVASVDVLSAKMIRAETGSHRPGTCAACARTRPSRAPRCRQESPHRARARSSQGHWES